MIHHKELQVNSFRITQIKNNSFRWLYLLKKPCIVNSMEEVNIRKIFGENVKRYRKQQGFSQEQLAEKLEISTNHLSVIETGTKFVTYKLLEKIILELDVLPSSLFQSTQTALNDNSLQNKINSVINQEIELTSERIKAKLCNIL